MDSPRLVLYAEQKDCGMGGQNAEEELTSPLTRVRIPGCYYIRLGKCTEGHQLGKEEGTRHA